MMPFEPFILSGRMGRPAFAAAVTTVYFGAIASQGLLIKPVLDRAGLIPFMIVHAVLLWVWLAIHAKRLRDAGRGIGSALAIAIVNVLSMGLLIFVISFLISPVEAQPGETAGGVLGTWIVLMVFIKVIGGATDPGWLGNVLLAILIIVLMPILLAVGFSIWVGTRKSVPAAQS